MMGAINSVPNGWSWETYMSCARCICTLPHWMYICLTNAETHFSYEMNMSLTRFNYPDQLCTSLSRCTFPIPIYISLTRCTYILTRYTFPLAISDFTDHVYIFRPDVHFIIGCKFHQPNGCNFNKSTFQ